MLKIMLRIKTVTEMPVIYCIIKCILITEFMKLATIIKLDYRTDSFFLIVVRNIQCQNYVLVSLFEFPLAFDVKILLSLSSVISVYSETSRKCNFSSV